MFGYKINGCFSKIFQTIVFFVHIVYCIYVIYNIGEVTE